MIDKKKKKPYTAPARRSTYVDDGFPGYIPTIVMPDFGGDGGSSFSTPDFGGGGGDFGGGGASGDW